MTDHALPARGERLHGLDAVRGLALLLGVVLHATMSFLPGGQVWIVADSARSTTLSVTFFVIHVMRLTVFFLIAGYFGRMVYHRIGATQFIKNRLRRIAIPLVVGWPIVLFLILVVAGAAAPPGTATPPTPGLSVENFPLTHLWFLYVLLILYAGALLLRGVVGLFDRGGRFRGMVDRLAGMLLHGWGPLLLAIPVAAALNRHPYWVPWFGVPTPDMSLIPNTAALVTYGLGFGLGWVIHRQSATLLSRFAKQWPWHLVLGVGATGVILATTSLEPVLAPMPFGSRKLWLAALYAVALWGWTFAMLGLGLRFLSGHSAWRRYLADASYWIYVAHLPLVMALQLVVRDWPLPWPVKFVVVLGIAMGVLLLTYKWFVRPTFIGATLNGRRIPRRAPTTQMKGAAVVRLLPLMLMLPLALGGQAPKAPAALTLDTVLARHKAAIGPIDGVATRRTMIRVSGMAPFEIPVTSEAMRPNLLLKRVDIQGTSQVTGFDGKDAWRIDPFASASGKPIDVPAAELHDLIEESDFDGALIGDGKDGIRLEYLGPKVVQLGGRGVAVHAVKVRFPAGQESVVHIDATTMLEVQRVQTRRIAGNMVELTLVSSDYRAVGGIQIPHLVEISAAGMPAPIRIVMEKVEWNVRLPREQFARPN